MLTWGEGQVKRGVGGHARAGEQWLTSKCREPEDRASQLV